MRRFLHVALLAAVLFAPVASGAAVFPRVLSETNGTLELEMVTHRSPGTLAIAEFFVALPLQGSYSVTVQPTTVVQHADSTTLPPGVSASALRAALVDTVTVSSPFLYRGARVVMVRVDVFRIVPGATAIIQLVDPRVIVQYTPAAAVNDGAGADPLLRHLVVNENVFPAAPGGSTPDPWFSLAQDWVRLGVVERGVYAVTGLDLGSALSRVGDPTTLRLFTTGGRAQARAFSDTTGTWRAGRAMREVPIRVEDGGDGTFGASDSIFFYGVGPQGWLDTYEPGAPDTLYYRHERATQNPYYLTWDAAIPGTPLRMGAVPATPTGGTPVTTTPERVHEEQDRIPHFDYGGDGWLWRDVPSTAPGAQQYGLSTVRIHDLDASRPQTFRTVALAPWIGSPKPPSINAGHQARYLVIRGSVVRTVGEYVWDGLSTQRLYEHGLPVRIDGFFLGDGDNIFRLQVPRQYNAEDEMFFAWFDLIFERAIRAVDRATALTSPATSGPVDFRATGFPASEAVRAFDVTNPWAPFQLTGLVQSADTVRFSADPGGQRRRYWIASAGGLKPPAAILVRVPRDLRAATSAPNMLIVTHGSLRSGAEALRAHRLSRLPLYAAPRVEVATTEEIYENFSGGMPDPMAIRNYVKFLYDNYHDAGGNPSLAYVVFLGDATLDWRNNVGPQPDIVPTHLYLTRLTTYAYATDDWMGHLDATDQSTGRAVLDVAIGRLPAQTPAEAMALVDKVISYETRAPRENWRSEIILVADDEISSFPGCETQWTDESEALTYTYIPQYAQVKKIYLTEYPGVGEARIKPAARFAFLDAWNRGALAVNFIGHGSSQQMADEFVFLNNDVGLLNNGLRLPVLFALSCTIGDFGSWSAKSLSEKLLLRQEGGVIATVTASNDSYPQPNRRLNTALFERVFPRRLGAGAPPLGVAVAEAKAMSMVAANFGYFQEENNWKYNLLADPATTLRVAGEEIRFQASPPDTMVAGLRKKIRGMVLRGGVLDGSFNGTVRVEVREPEIDRTYQTECSYPPSMKYRVPGGAMYEGTADVTAGRFEVDIRVPRFARTGPRAFVTAYATDGVADAAATADSLLQVLAPTLADSLALRPRDGSPRVALGFKSGLHVVKPGETVRAVVRDADGINVLETINEGRQAILIDDLAVPIGANEFFAFDHGGTDTSGALLYPLPDLGVGDHRLIYKVSDSFGLTTLDTLLFSVTDAQNYYAEAVLNYPNPFKTDTRFLFRVSDRASIRLDVYTLSGKRIRRMETARDGGEVWVYWDGRDAVGDEIANGTYLYVATVTFVGVDRPPAVLRGKLAKIR
ncbi:MAG: C25 family cysteine peptidase [Candidatus Krumholzibacteria bacterium]|nr:C25 family cysteine peptidase [Candidatus Krumholzibacteria bacterium]